MAGDKSVDVQLGDILEKLEKLDPRLEDGEGKKKNGFFAKRKIENLTNKIKNIVSSFVSARKRGYVSRVIDGTQIIVDGLKGLEERDSEFYKMVMDVLKQENMKSVLKAIEENGGAKIEEVENVSVE